MLKLQNKYVLKIPEDVSIFYCTFTNFFICKGSVKTKSFKTETKLILLPQTKLIIVSDVFALANNVSLSTQRKLIQQKTIAKIKQSFFEISNILYQKLQLVGVGYKVLISETSVNQLILKVGFNHSIFIRIPTNIETRCFKSTDLFLNGDCSVNDLSQTMASIRNCKIPEPYKGKGILYYNEKITLKKGKKI